MLHSLFRIALLASLITFVEALRLILGVKKIFNAPRPIGRTMDLLIPHPLKSDHPTENSIANFDLLSVNFHI
jgi:hypothetical protein